MSNENNAYRPDDPRPFGSPLEEVGQGRRETFLQLESRPDLFVRRRPLGQRRAEGINQATDKFAQMRNFGVNVPNFKTVIGEGDDGPAEFWIADRVQGETLDTLVAARAELPVDVTNRTFDGIANYLKDGQENGTPVYSDFALRQFMLGHTRVNPEQDLYLTDIDTTFGKVDGEVLHRVTLMMQAVHELAPLEGKIWATMRELIIANDAGRVSGAEQESLLVWLDENLPPRV